MDDNKFSKKIYNQHVKKLKNLLVPHKKLIICFSGIAGSGKTYIAKILEKRYRGVRIRNDDIRGIIMSLDKSEHIDELTYRYLNWFIENYKFRNNLIILDSGIDRVYREKFSLFKKKGYKIFIIRLKVSRKKSEKRIIKKLGKLDNNYINNIDRWVREWKEFGKNVKPDIIIENENKLNLEPLFNQLDKITIQTS